VPNVGTLNFIKQTIQDLQVQIDPNTMIAGDFKTPLPPTDPEKKNNSETSELNDTINQMDLTDIYKIFHPAAAHYMVFSKAHRIISKIEHIFRYKKVLTNIVKLK
jgi:hypothetical protein